MVAHNSVDMLARRESLEELFYLTNIFLVHSNADYAYLQMSRDSLFNLFDMGVVLHLTGLPPDVSILSRNSHKNSRIWIDLF